LSFTVCQEINLSEPSKRQSAFRKSISGALNDDLIGSDQILTESSIIFDYRYLAFRESLRHDYLCRFLLTAIFVSVGATRSK